MSSVDKVRIKINNLMVEANPGMTVLECARKNGIYIPALCYLEGLPVRTACRLCLVEISGKPQALPACQVKVEEGLEIITSSPELEELRRAILELILSEHPYFCLACREKNVCKELKVTMARALETGGCVFCPRDGDCELQKVVEYLKIKKIPYDYKDRNRQLWLSDPFIIHNPNLCITCGRCLRACAELRGENVLTFSGRGENIAVDTFFHRSLRESGCSFCGACLDVCPVAAFSERGVYTAAADSIYEQSFICQLCSSACELRAEFHEDGSIRRIKPASPGAACARGRFGFKELFNRRLPPSSPILRQNGRQSDSSLDQALAAVVEAIRKYKPEEIAFVSSGLAAAQSLLAFYSLAGALGVKNLFYLAPGDFYGKLSDLEERLGISIARRLDLEELPKFQSFFLVDLDILSEGLTLWLEIKKSLNSGAGLLVLDSGPNRSARTAEVYLKCHPEKKALALLAITGTVLTAAPGLSFYRGYHEFLERLKEISVDRAVREAGLQPGKVKKAVDLLLSSSPSLFLFGERFLRQPAAEENLTALWNLALKLEAGLLPVQAAAGALLVERLKKKFKLRVLESQEEIDRMIEAGKIKFLYVLGDLPLRRKPEFLVVQKPFRTAEAGLADVYLPSATFIEENTLVVDATGRFKKIDSGKQELRQWNMTDEEILNNLAERIPVRLSEAADHPEFYLKEEMTEKEFTASYLPFRPAAEEPEKGVFPASDSGSITIIVGRNLDVYSGVSFAGEMESFRAISDPDWLWLNETQARSLGFEEGQKVFLETEECRLELEVRLSPELFPGCGVIFPILDDSVILKLYNQGIVSATIKVKK